MHLQLFMMWKNILFIFSTVWIQLSDLWKSYNEKELEKWQPLITDFEISEI